MAQVRGFTSIINGDLVTTHGVLHASPLTWDADGVLISVGEAPPEDAAAIDAAGCLVLPGFINLHVHGGSGVDTLDGTVDALATLAADQAAQGVTTFLPTTASAPQERLLQVAAALREYPEDATNSARIGGWYVEGPYLSPAKCGAQNPDYLRDPSLEEYQAWQEASGSQVRIVALAPERDPRGEFIRAVTADGVTVSAAHTDAEYATAQMALAAGLRHATHTFNAMSRFDYRNPGILETLLNANAVMLEVIPDCTEVPHVHPATIRLLAKIAGTERMVAVTDAMAAAGMPDGEYELGDLAVIKDGELAYLKDAWQQNGVKSLAGSVLHMNRGYANLVEKVGFDFVQAIRMCSLNPARVLGIEDRCGSLEVDKQADVTVLDAVSYEVRYVFRRGVQVYPDVINDRS